MSYLLKKKCFVTFTLRHKFRFRTNKCRALLNYFCPFASLARETRLLCLLRGFVCAYNPAARVRICAFLICNIEIVIGKKDENKRKKRPGLPHIFSNSDHQSLYKGHKDYCKEIIVSVLIQISALSVINPTVSLSNINTIFLATPPVLRCIVLAIPRGGLGVLMGF